MTDKARSSSPVYRHCTQCGGQVVQGRSDRDFQCSVCGFHLYINPIAAVAAILVNPQNEVLLIRRAIEPGKGRLGLPGGFVDPGETAEEAVRREVHEEVGLPLDDYRFYLSLPNRYLHQNIEWPVLDLFFTLEMENFQDASAESEVEEVVIVPLEALDLDLLAFVSIREAMRLFRDQRLG